MEKSRQLSRQSSAASLQRGSFVRYALTSPRCRLCLCVGVVFSAGILCGAYLSGYFLDRDGGLFSRRPARGVDTGTKKERPGLSIKKDLSIQFRDYIPRHVFIDVSVGPPHSLELFLETYPDAHKYTLYAFLADSAYQALYSKFPKLSLYPGTVPSTTQKSTTMVISTGGQRSAANHSLPISTLNFSTWLKDNVHPDEYVIVKLTTDPKNEEEIVRQLVTSEALEWIDKFYTTSSDPDVVEIAKERFSTRGLSVFLWDDEKYTYSDFDDVNPTSREQGLKISDCQVENNTRTYFTMLLYLSKVNKYSSASLSLLRKLLDEHANKHPVTLLTLFLPTDYVESRSLCEGLLSLGRQMELGLYLHDSSFSAIRSGDAEEQQNRIRNKLVYAEHCFAAGNTTLDYTLSKAKMLKLETQHSHAKHSGKKDEALLEDNMLLKKIISDRKYTIISDVYDMTPVLEETRIDFSKVIEESSSGSLLAMDISAQGTDTALLQLLTSHTSSLVPLSKCVDMEIKRRQ